MAAKVDIIIPNFNNAKYLNDCLLSILNQKFQEWIAYIVDDGSKDNSLEIIKYFVQQDKRFKLISLTKNKGPAFCRNLALRVSNSHYVAFLDSDDYWDSGKLSLHLDHIFKNNIDFGYTDYFVFNNKKNFHFTNVKSSYDYEGFLKDTSIGTSTIILKRSIIKNIKFKKLKIMEDYLFKCDLLKKGFIAYKFNQPLTWYRLTPDSRNSNAIKNILFLWKLNRNYQKINFFKNIFLLLNICLNSIKKYHLKKY